MDGCEQLYLKNQLVLATEPFLQPIVILFFIHKAGSAIIILLTDLL